MNLLKRLLLAFTVIITISLVNNCSAYQNEQDGFRNLKWGMYPYQFPQDYMDRKSVDLPHEKVHGLMPSDTFLCKDVEEKRLLRLLVQGKGSVSGVPVNSEVLTFLDNQLVGVDVLIEGNPKDFSNKMKAMYGAPDKEEGGDRKILGWVGNKTLLTLFWQPKEADKVPMIITLLDAKSIEKIYINRTSPKNNGW